MQAKITLPFYEADKLNIPLVVGSFTIADGRQVQCFFIIDTGSRDNVLNAKAVKYLAIENLLDEKYAVTSLEGKGEECAVANVDFELGGEEFHESFCICQSLDFQEVLGLNGILGILGSRFLSKRGLALDCGARCLRESDIEGVMINEDTFLCPMQYGFQTYGIPLIAVTKDDEKFLFVADSGCDTTTISQKAIDGTTECKLTDEEDAVHSICGTAKVKMANVKFALCSQTIGENKTKCIEAEDEVKVLPFDYVDPGKSEEQKPPIFGLMSCKYMMRHKWVLDYKIGYIYSSAA